MIKANTEYNADMRTEYSLLKEEIIKDADIYKCILIIKV